MSTRQYIGARYVPKFFDWGGSAEWRSGVAYEALTIVTRNGNSYTSKIPVPSNIGEPENNPEYWAATGLYNEQIESYRQLVLAVESTLNGFMADGAIGTSNLADSAITTPKIADNAVTNPKIDAGSISEDKIATSLLNIIKNYYVTPEQYGALGDGVNDDTDSIQQALDSGKPVIFSPKTYNVSVVTGETYALNIPSDTTVVFNNTVIKLLPNDLQNYQIICIDGSNNVNIYGMCTVEGDRATHTGVDGEWGLGVAIGGGSSNVSVCDLTIKYCWGDGIYVNNADDVYINNCKCVDNRRNNISVIRANNIKVCNCYFSHAYGTNPQSNISVEANTTDDLVKNAVFENCICENTVGDYAAYVSVKANGNSVTFDNCELDKDFSFSALSGDYNNVIVKDCHIISSSHAIINVGNLPEHSYLSYVNVTFEGGGAIIWHTGDYLCNLRAINCEIKNSTFERLGAYGGTHTNISNNYLEFIANPDNVTFTNYVSGVFYVADNNEIKVTAAKPLTYNTAVGALFFNNYKFNSDTDAKRAIIISSVAFIPMGQTYYITNIGAQRATVEVAPGITNESTGESLQLVVLPVNNTIAIQNINGKLYYKLLA